MANLVVARKKTKGRGGLIFFVCCCHIFWIEKRRYREKVWFGTFDLFVIFDLFGNADGITGTQCLIW